MKEFSKLSIEEKAKAYDEAKLRMKIALNSNRCTIGFMNEIFPELKESDDESIKKELISFLRRYDPFLTQKFIDWIEKQGENHDDKYNITGIKSKHAEGKLGEMIKEIKSTDKVEPKFHEGEWITIKE